MDISERLVETAKERTPQIADHFFVDNALSWDPPRPVIVISHTRSIPNCSESSIGLIEADYSVCYKTISYSSVSKKAKSTRMALPPYP